MPHLPIAIRQVSQLSEADLAGLAALLADAVDDGASVGFIAPLASEEAAHYWQGVATAVGRGSKLLWLATAGDRIIGSVQLEPAGRANGSHRAEVQKLLVLRAHRRQGAARALMQALENEAVRLGRHLLVLDTRQGDSAEQLYRSLGWTEAGVIPGYARSSSGVFTDTVFFYKGPGLGT
jgi:GNAT superfamily N-acetyltransferase